VREAGGGTCIVYYWIWMEDSHGREGRIDIWLAVLVASYSQFASLY